MGIRDEMMDTWIQVAFLGEVFPLSDSEYSAFGNQKQIQK